MSSRVDLLLFIGCMILSLVALVLPLQLRDPITETLRRTLVAPLVGLQSGAERWRTAWQLSEERTARLDSAVLRGFNAVALQTENDQLRKLLGLGARLRVGFVPAEAVHNDVRPDVVTTLMLTAGSRVGVKTYSPVVAPDGIVGLVQTVDPTISIAILYSHPDFRASAMSGDGKAFGIVYPHLERRLGSGVAGHQLELRGVPFRTALEKGTMIYTSGLGGAFPRGIPIGMVQDEMKTVEGWTRTYLLDPAVNLSKVNTVMILLPQRMPDRVDNVWQMVATVDSATRALLSHGDSIVRRSAADSLRRAAASAAPDSALSRVDTARRPAAVAAPARDSVRAGTVRRAPADTSARPRPAVPAPRRDSARVDAPVRRDTTTRRDTTPARPDTSRPPAARPDTTRPDTTGQAHARSPRR
jgi:rod shape-determining protein MreC